MKAIIDKAIPYIQGVLEPFFDVEYLPGKEIDRAKAADADVLLIRTRTHCNEALLSGSKVKLVATATIGCDHIDMPWCQKAGIKVVNAPGCNSSAVMEYFFTAIYKLAEMKDIDLLGQTIGVVGVGHVGSKVANMAEELGFRVLRNDPPRMAAEGPKGFVELDYLLKHSDIVTIHIPLENNLDFAGDHFFDSMKDGAIFVNASRGEVIVEEAFLRNRPRFAGVVMDVWRHEPDITPAMLEAADIATPHIAGYSMQGKINGTTAVVRATGEFFDIPELKEFSLPSAEKPFSLTRYDIMADDAALRSAPESFESLRSNYNYR